LTVPVVLDVTQDFRVGEFTCQDRTPKVLSMTSQVDSGNAPASTSLQIEVNGINVIPENERHGTPRSLFWPWATASIALFNISIAGLLVTFGMGFLPTMLAAVVGIGCSFFLVGLIGVAGKRAAAPTMVIPQRLIQCERPARVIRSPERVRLGAGPHTPRDARISGQGPYPLHSGTRVRREAD
jgi:hypothetical protein